MTLRARRGFTLIELLLATAIAAVLLGGMLLIVGQLTRESSKLAAHQADPAAEERLVELVRLDLVRGREIDRRTSDGAIHITGYGSIDGGDSGRPTAKACDVVYRLAKSEDGQSILLRDQSLRGDPTRKTWTALVAVGVGRFDVGPVAKPTSNPTSREATADRALPGEARLLVEWADPKAKAIDRVLTLR